MEGRNRPKGQFWSLGVIIVILALLAFAGWQLGQNAPAKSGVLAPAGADTGAGAPVSSSDQSVSAPTANGIVVGQSYKNDLSPALRDMKPIPPSAARKAEENENPPIRVPGQIDQKDTVVQRTFSPGEASQAIPAPVGGWNGIASQGAGGGGCNCAPPDTNGEVGPNNYVQTVNTAFQIWDKSGRSLYGPANINTIWSGFGGACQTRNDGDPIVLYDQLANRWIISQFTSASPYDECVAVSQTGDPTGAWYRYAFQLSTSDFPDYPKLGVWPDGYYMTVNWFRSGITYAGPRPYVFDRAHMLNGQAATFQTTSAALGSGVAPMLPADLDGTSLPPAGAPNYNAEFGNPLGIWKFHVDWNTPGNTTFTNSANLSTAGFTQLCTTTRNCIPQRGVTQKVDGIGDRLMHRLAYRNLNGVETMVVNHSVDAGGGVAGVRWYEIRNPGGSPSIYQQGTYSPDSNSRWMGSVAMNGQGDIALGYSVSSSSLYPSIRYTGRLSTDALGTMPQGEGSIYEANGSQSGVNRWGDYSAMSVDPADDCTFWYTQEYNESSNWYWKTKIGSFRVGSCSAGGPTPTPTTPPPPTNTPTAVPPTNTPTAVPPTNTPTNTPTVNPNPADFSVVASPGSQTISRRSGNSANYTVNLTSLNGFTGNVSLSVSGLPNRTSGSFSPTSVTLTSGGSGQSTLTVTSTSRSGPTGTFTLTITGTSSGGISHTATVTLTVNK